MVIKKYYLFLITFLFIAGVFASYSVGNPSSSIENSYSKGGDISGWINISINNELATSEFKAFINNSEDKSISLLDLLKTDSRNDYNCSSEDCEISYSGSNPSEEKSFNLNKGNTKLIVLKINDDINQIDSISFNIESNALENENNQIKVDFLNDGVIDSGNNKTSSEYGSENYGCYSSLNGANSEYGLTGEGYCQEIELDEAPGYLIGANIKRNSGTGDATATLYDKDFNFIKECTIAEEDISDTGFEKAYCNIDYLVSKKDKYYVCVSYDWGTDYWIKGYHTEDGCGFYGSSSPENPTDAYSIFAISKKFGDVGTITISDSYEDDFTDILNNYLNDKYDDLDCSTHDCIIPIKIISGVDNQAITLKDLDLRVELKNGATKKETKFYDGGQTVPSITLNNPLIYLDNSNFSVPETEGLYNFKLKFKNHEVFSKDINVKKGISIYSIYPSKTANGLPTNFIISLDEKNITKYNWDFGDGTTFEGTTSSAQHTYDSKGDYSLSVSVTNNLGTISTKSFMIHVGSAGEVLGDLIDDYLNNTATLELSLLAYDSDITDSLKKVLDLDNIKNKLNYLKTNYTSITDGDEAKYQALLSQLLEINIPKSIAQTTNSDNLVFYPDKSNIDLDALSSATGENYDLSIGDNYKDSIVSWYAKNIQTTMSLKGYSGDYGYGNEFLAKIFDLNIRNSNSNNGSYLFIKDDLIFDNSSFNHEEGYYYKKLSGNENIEISSKEDINIEDLPIFIAPSISSLNVVDNNGDIQEAGNNFNWTLFFIVIFVVIIIGVFAYIFLKKWYANKYESSLFKNKNDLYNMVTYVQGAKKKGMSNEEIMRNLRKAKWSNEKINYVMRKYSGKNTGMPGFSAKKPFKK